MISVKAVTAVRVLSVSQGKTSANRLCGLAPASGRITALAAVTNSSSGHEFRLRPAADQPGLEEFCL